MGNEKSKNEKLIENRQQLIENNQRQEENTKLKEVVEKSKDELNKKDEQLEKERKKNTDLEEKLKDIKKKYGILKNKYKEIKEKLEEDNKIVRFPEENEIEEYDNIIEEEKTLLEKKKTALVSTITIIKKELTDENNNIKDINDLCNYYNKSDRERLNTNLQNTKFCCCCDSDTYLKFNFKFLGFFFVMFYFIGIFQLIWIMNTTTEELNFAFKSFIFRKNRTDYYSKDFNFIKNYENNIFMNLPDFNLFFFCSLIGNATLKCCDFRFSLFIFMALNAGSIYTFRIINFPDNYEFKQLFIILPFYICFNICIGSIALFGQQIFFDGLNLYYSIENGNNNNIAHLFFYLWLSEIPSYFINLLINFFLRKINYLSEYGLDFFIVSIILFSACSLISIFLYSCYSIVLKKNKKEKTAKRIVNRICGHIIYREEKPQGKDIKEINCSEESGKDKMKNNQRKICCYSGKLGARKFIKNLEKMEEENGYSCYKLTGLMCCCNILFRCFCCYNNKDNLSEYNQEIERFCYLYKVQREVSWFSDLITKNNLIDLIIYKLLNDLLILGFEKQLKTSLKKNEFELKNNIIMILVFLAYFTFFASLNKIIPEKCFNCCQNFLKLNNDGKNQNSGEYIKQRYGTAFLTLFNLICTTILSSFLIFGDDILKDFTLKYLIALPIALTKFYIFILTKSLLNTMDYENIDLLSNSIIISLISTFCNFLCYIVTDIIINIEPKYLYIFQFSIGMLIFFIVFVSVIVLCVVDDSFARLQNFYSKCNSCCDCDCDCCLCNCCNNISNKCDCDCCDCSNCSDCSCCDCSCSECDCCDCDCSCKCSDNCSVCKCECLDNCRDCFSCRRDNCCSDKCCNCSECCDCSDCCSCSRNNCCSDKCCDCPDCCDCSDCCSCSRNNCCPDKCCDCCDYS